MWKRHLEGAAVAWALDEVERELRDEPAHRLAGQRADTWSIVAPNDIGVVVEAIRLDSCDPASVEFDLLAVAEGLLPGHARAERRVLLPLGGHAAREPELLYLVFETSGHVYAFESLQAAGDSLEGVDLPDYVGAFSDLGEVVTISSGDLWIEFTSTGTFDNSALQALIRKSGTSDELAADPHRFALSVWHAS